MTGRRVRLGDLAFVALNVLVVWSLWPIGRGTVWELAAGLGTVWYSWAFSDVIFGFLRVKYLRLFYGRDTEPVVPTVRGLDE